MTTYYYESMLILAVLSLVLYLLFKNPYTNKNSDGEYIYSYKRVADKMGEFDAGYEELWGITGKNKEDAQMKADIRRTFSNSQNKPQYQYARIIITKKYSYIKNSYYLPITLLLSVITYLIFCIYYPILFMPHHVPSGVECLGFIFMSLMAAISLILTFNLIMER